MTGDERPIVYDSDYMGRVYGPYSSSADADDDAAKLARGAFSRTDSGDAAGERRYVSLINACTRAGIDLGIFDERVLAWLSGRELPSTVQVVVGLISRANRDFRGTP